MFAISFFSNEKFRLLKYKGLSGVSIFRLVWLYWMKERQLTRQRLLGIRETSFNGRNTLNERNIRKSTSTFASANTVIELTSFQYFQQIWNYLDNVAFAWYIECLLIFFYLAKQKRVIYVLKLFHFILNI